MIGADVFCIYIRSVETAVRPINVGGRVRGKRFFQIVFDRFPCLSEFNILK